MNQPNEQVIFSKVSTRDDRQRVFRLLVEGRIQFTVQGVNKKPYQFVGLGVAHGGLHISLSHPADDLAVRSQLKTPFLVSFEILPERYYMKAEIKYDKDQGYILDTSADLYSLQRRSSYRIQIPNDYGASVFIQFVGEELVEAELALHDLSGGGMAIDILPSESMNQLKAKFKLGSLVKGTFFISQSVQKDFEAVVRYSKSVGSAGSGFSRVGLQFQNFTSQDNDEIISIVMKIYWELHSKFKMTS